jgi:hypothetical protein
MANDVRDVILNVLEISKKAVGISKKVMDLEKDPRVVHVSLENITRLVWQIEMKKPFGSIEEVKAYLDEHKIIYTEVIEGRNKKYIFENESYHPDNVRGVFYASSKDK